MMISQLLVCYVAVVVAFYAAIPKLAPVLNDVDNDQRFAV
jgi:hypothetical protein